VRVNECVLAEKGEELISVDVSSELFFTLVVAGPLAPYVCVVVDVVARAVVASSDEEFTSAVVLRIPVQFAESTGSACVVGDVRVNECVLAEKGEELVSVDVSSELYIALVVAGPLATYVCAVLDVVALAVVAGRDKELTSAVVLRIPVEFAESRVVVPIAAADLLCWIIAVDVAVESRIVDAAESNGRPELVPLSPFTRPDVVTRSVEGEMDVPRGASAPEVVLQPTSKQPGVRRTGVVETTASKLGIAVEDRATTVVWLVALPLRGSMVGSVDAIGAEDERVVGESTVADNCVEAIVVENPSVVDDGSYPVKRHSNSSEHSEVIIRDASDTDDAEDE